MKHLNINLTYETYYVKYVIQGVRSNGFRSRDCIEHKNNVKYFFLQHLPALRL